jgi:2-methylaconitate cis-trans-isomerase PrpF
VLHVESIGDIPVTIMDAANLFVFVQASQLGLLGTEIDELDSNRAISSKLDSIRRHAAVMLGFASTLEEAGLRSPIHPRIAMVAPPQNYRTSGGELIEEAQLDFLARMMAMGSLHRAYGVSGTICTAGAAMIEGTVVNEVIESRIIGSRTLRLGHPAGVIELGADLENEGGVWKYREAVVHRTARRLMEGYVLVPGKCRTKI